MPFKVYLRNGDEENGDKISVPLVQLKWHTFTALTAWFVLVRGIYGSER